MKKWVIRTSGGKAGTSGIVFMFLLAFLCSLVPVQGALAQTQTDKAPAPNLGTAADFAALAGGALTCGSTVITGPAGTVNGPATACLGPDVHIGDGMAVSAYADFLTAYGALQFVACDALVPGTLAGLTLTPGVYCLDPSGKTAVLTLDGLGDPNAVWIFKTETSALSATNFSVQMINPPGIGCQAPPPHVYWWSSASATLVTTSFIGTILAGVDISVTGGTITGRTLATGAVTFVAGPPGGAIICNCAPLTIDPAILPSPVFGIPYNQPITASGGTGPYTYTVSAGILPAGLALSPAGPTLTGALVSGIPTVVAPYNFTIMATDSDGCAGTAQVYTGQVCPVLTMAPPTIPSPVLGVPYSQPITASGGTGPYTFTLGGTLPSGLALTPAGPTLTGALISGIPTAVGPYSFSVMATDANNCSGSVTYAGQACSVVSLTPATLTPGLVAAAYTQTIAASGGTGTYTYTYTGTLPPGLTLSSTGVLTGITTAGGSFTFTVIATDASGCTGSMTYTLAIAAYDVYLFDDYGRAFLCLNSATGAYRYTILKGVGVGSVFTGTAITNLTNGILNFHTPVGLPYSLVGSDLKRYHKGKATFTQRPLRINSAIVDSNTLNNPPNWCTGF